MKRFFVISLCILFLLACTSEWGDFSLLSGGYSYTREIEDGEVNVWISPDVSTKEDNLKFFARDCAERLPWGNDYIFTEFTDPETFFSSLSQAVISGNGPDVVLSNTDEWSLARLDMGYTLDLSSFFKTLLSEKKLDPNRVHTPLFDEFSTLGRLYLAPLWFSSYQLIKNPSEEDLLGIFSGESFDDYVKKLEKVSKSEVLLSSVLSGISPPWTAFQDITDDIHCTTRFKEKKVQHYCDLWIKAKRAEAGINMSSNQTYSWSGSFQSDEVAGFHTEQGQTSLAYGNICASVIANTGHLQKCLMYLESLYDEDWALNYGNISAPYSAYSSVLEDACGMHTFFPKNYIDVFIEQIYGLPHRVEWVGKNEKDKMNAFFDRFVTEITDRLPTQEEYEKLDREICISMGK